MFDWLLSYLAPHYCCSCGKVGEVLCPRCKNYILKQMYAGCVLCGQTGLASNLCSRHRLSYGDLWCAAERQKVLANLIDDYKFHRQVAGAKVLAELLAACLPELASDTVIVPVPTAPKNVRIRGYDHMVLVARELAKLCGLRVASLLQRRNNLTQHFAPSAAERKKRAKGYFAVKSGTLPDAPLLLIDDIFTTGATLNAAADCLKKAGARQINAAVIARQVYS